MYEAPLLSMFEVAALKKLNILVTIKKTRYQIFTDIQ